MPGEVELPLLPLAALPVELPVELPPDEPLELLLKWASHSAREICPSLFLSTSAKLGCEDAPEALELPPLAAGEEVDEEDDGLLVEEPVELLPLADGELAEGVLDDDGLLDEED